MTGAGPASPWRLYVGTPTINGIMIADHVVALMGMSMRLAQAGIPWTYRCIDGPNAMVQRDLLAHHFLASDATHLLLVDGNTAFPADLPERLLGAGREVVGTASPRGAPDLARTGRLLPAHGFDDAYALGFDWQVELLPDGITVAAGFGRVAALGTGFLLIARSCLERMIAAGIAEPYEFRRGEPPIHAVFRDFHEAEKPWDGDFAFSRRWRACGGEIWVDAEADLRRIGDMHFGMPFIRFLSALRDGIADPALASPPPA